LRVLHLTTHEHSGAGRAAVRIHRALRNSGVESEVLVLHGTGTEPGIGMLGGPARRRFAGYQRSAEEALFSLQGAGDGGYRSLGLWGAGLSAIRRGAADIVHLHWIPGLLAIADLPRIDRPVVWTFHDQWPLCGAEHYTELARPRSGYDESNRRPGNSGPDLDRWTWRRKLSAWREFTPSIVCPSRWLADEAGGSVLFGKCQVQTIPYPLDLSVFRPQDRVAARDLLRLPAGRTLLLFGASDPTGDRRKGFHVLSDALRHLAGRGLTAETDLVVYGAEGGGQVHGFNTHWMGFIRDDSVLSSLYSACDLFAIPSLQDNLPNTLIEAMACGLPAVGSNAGGITDLIRDKVTGLLAAPGDASQLADRIELLLRDPGLRSRMGKEARRSIETICDERAVADRYVAIYQSAMQSRR
jgi:glycosyltransferase involved in cell wall biosynthesis